MKEIRSRQKKRRINFREERKLILLGVEGKNRSEFLYFKNFNSLQNRYRIKKVFGNNTHLQGIINEMKTYIKNNGLSDGDLLYCLFDMDFDKNKMKNIQKIIKENKLPIRFLPSNPCFEVFLLFHFMFTTKQFENFGQLERELKKHLPNYRKGENYFELLEPLADVCIKNCDKVLLHHNACEHDFCDMNPSTNAHELVKILKDIK